MPKRVKVHKVHRVRPAIMIQELTNAGSSLELDLYADAQKIGTLIIGQGSLYCTSRNA